jgi:hypothetical protein
MALLAAALATFGPAGLLLALPILGLWAYIYFSRSRTRAFAHGCVAVLVSFCLIGLVLPLTFNNAREAARRTQCAGNLKQIAAALNNYHGVHGTFPPAVIADKNGKPMHSWRVLLLPYVSEKSRYGKYNFQEPWDGPNNSKLLNPMPDIYRCPSDVRTGHGQGVWTSYVAVVGPRTAWPGVSARKIDEITDGTANTILVLENRNADIPWMAPRDVSLEEVLGSFTSVDPQPAGVHYSESFFYHYSIGRNVAFADAYATFLYQYDGLPRVALSNLLTIDDGVSLDPRNLGIPFGGTKRLKVGSCYRLAVFVFLIVLPLPWVGRNSRISLDSLRVAPDFLIRRARPI